MNNYTIEIKLEPENFNNKPHYFWCIIKQNEQNILSNCGHGWAESIVQAAEAAEKYYMNNIFPYIY